ncbi:MAG: hypothetical protein HDT40_00805 [Lachnospiraceae bacterium]|nr:hypothetical protein [Lachnospiraceae bacterium]
MKKTKKLIIAALTLAGIVVLIFGITQFIKFANFYRDTWNIDFLTFLWYMLPYLFADLFILGIIIEILKREKKKKSQAP